MVNSKTNTQGSLLYLDGVTVDFEGFKALNELSFIASPNSLQAVIGPNGAGKTTFMDVVTGRTRPTSGRVIYKEKIDLTRFDETAIVSLGIARKFQRPSVFPYHSVAKNLELAVFKKKNIWNTTFLKDTNLDNNLLENVASKIGLENYLQNIAGSLSHGQKQWLEIGMLLAQECELLMLDEPVAGMTDEETEKTAILLKEISKERSLIVIEHDIDFIESLLCSVKVLNEGTILAEGTMADLKKNKEVIEVYLGR